MLKAVLICADAVASKDERYFVEQNDQTSELLEMAVKNNPQNVQLWMELAEMNMRKPGPNRSELQLFLF